MSCDVAATTHKDTPDSLCFMAPGVPGSLGFMAPEAMLRNVPDPTKLDVWSAACVLLELVRYATVALTLVIFQNMNLYHLHARAPGT